MKIIQNEIKFEIGPLDGRNTISDNMNDIFVPGSIDPEFFVLAKTLDFTTTATDKTTPRMCTITNDGETERKDIKEILEFLNITNPEDHALTEHQIEVFVKGNIEMMNLEGRTGFLMKHKRVEFDRTEIYLTDVIFHSIKKILQIVPWKYPNTRAEIRFGEKHPYRLIYK